jgi:O-antigen/teichoic acid export membrane protein
MVSGERMSFLLVVGAVESAAAIAAALVAKMRGVNGVEVFAGVLAAGGALSLIVHIVCCRAVFPGVRLRLSCPAARLREAAAFLSWGTLSSVGNAVKYKGTSLVVNGFTGVAFNATWDVAIKAWQYLHGFCADFMQAFSPVLFKAWGAGERRRVASVAAWTTFASFLIAAVPSAVVFAFAPELVRVWLGEAAPPQVAAFVRCSVVNLVFDAASNPLTTTILASGRVALYHSVACSLSVLGFAVAWLLLASGFPAWTSMAAVAATNGLAVAYRALHVRFAR